MDSLDHRSSRGNDCFFLFGFAPIGHSLGAFLGRHVFGVRRHAPKVANPLARSPAAVAAGLVLFRTHCVACHGAPGVDPTEAGASLNPPAPGLTAARVQARSDGELKWIVSNGIRMTGMPAFGASRSEGEVWQLVAALRRLPKLSSEERHMLARER